MTMTAPTPVPAIIGWAVLGGGMAVIAPTVLGAAADVADTPVPVAIAAVSTVGYLGSFTGPPLVGGLAGLSDLTTALGLLMVAAMATAVLASRLHAASTTRRADDNRDPAP